MTRISFYQITLRRSLKKGNQSAKVYAYNYKELSMKSMRLVLIIAGVLASPFALASENVDAGRQLYKQNCAVCHGATGGMDMSKRLAPPIMGVKMHYVKKHPDKESFVAAVVSWLDKPEESKSLMKMAIHKFKLMPKIPVSDADAEKIAVYMFEGKLEKPEGFDEHVKKMHGGKGMKGHKHGGGEKGGCDGMKH